MDEYPPPLWQSGRNYFHFVVGYVALFEEEEYYL